jgi:hypothetical protein
MDVSARTEGWVIGRAGRRARGQSWRWRKGSELYPERRGHAIALRATLCPPAIALRATPSPPAIAANAATRAEKSPASGWRGFFARGKWLPLLAGIAVEIVFRALPGVTARAQ